ncbi:hypothetical protein BKP37_09985 [Anaerobacillus alkalilacustris]|uniref:ABC-2 type transporter transmembrane domain-containing protein n=1 Tax=Anaerobacillus alkalilacustris TaxID=393763 RepID=A0A1S2LMP6_9BACI|nr:ABC transporter permease [Anaerobacillus alkalilacustris]OIJ13604.1 hypothetical protein BKP37_09985 [Anaerobacillus alkalilacustris]
MFWNLLKKDLLQLLRDRKELVILLLMPIILISILGFSLRGMIEGNVSDFTIDIAVVDEGNYHEQRIEFERLLEEINLPIEVREVLLQLSEELSIPEMLVDRVLTEELSEFINLEKKPSLDGLQSTGETIAILHFPKDYRLTTWKAMFLEEENPLALDLYLNEEEAFQANIISDIIESFYRQFNINTSLGKKIADLEQSNFSNEFQFENIGVTTHFENLKPVTSFDYYTIGMAVMFVLYAATYAAGYAYTEKQTFVFDRMLLANINLWVYGLSKWVSTSLIAVIQLCVIFGVSAVFYNVHWPNPVNFLVVTVILSVSVGSLGVLVTALCYKFETNRLVDIFSGGIISIMAFLGGSFTPVNIFSESLWKIGSLTPNGSALQSYLLVMRGGELSSALPALISSIFFSILLVLVSVWIFPKRRMS